MRIGLQNDSADPYTQTLAAETENAKGTKSSNRDVEKPRKLAREYDVTDYYARPCDTGEPNEELTI